MTLTQEQGEELVSLARSTLESFVSGRPLKTPGEEPFLKETRGVFVTLTVSDPPGELRGCIGFPYPIKPLGEAVVEATVASASEDPRFPPVGPGELPSLVVEVSALTQPEPLDSPTPSGRPARVRIGVDGLIVSRHRQSGLLLPQVATEYGMGAEEFLSQACLKAGLPPDSWLDPVTEVQVFQAEIFREENPGGKAARHSNAT